VFHTRLTHSLKVAQVARRIAEQFVSQDEALFPVLDPDAVEAAALAHDLGHPPFGHIAEEELHKAALKAGGFEGNAQSFRIVTRLALRDGESPDGPYRGLNLTWRVLDGMVKYPVVGQAAYDQGSEVPKLAAYFSEGDIFRQMRLAAGHEVDEGRSAIAELMDWADDVTYAVHDVEDFFRAGLLPLWTLEPGSEALETFIEYHARRTEDADGDLTREFVCDLIDPTTSQFAVPDDGSSRARAALRQTASNYIGRYIDGVAVDTENGLPTVQVEGHLKAEVKVLKSLVWYFVIENSPLATVQHGQRRVIKKLCEWYGELAADPQQWRHFPERTREWLKESAELEDADRHQVRIVTDYIASATEDQVVSLYRRMGGYADSSPFDGAAG
jgi:dGTPase